MGSGDETACVSFEIPKDELVRLLWRRALTAEQLQLLRRCAAAIAPPGLVS